MRRVRRNSPKNQRDDASALLQTIPLNDGTVTTPVTIAMIQALISPFQLEAGNPPPFAPPSLLRVHPHRAVPPKTHHVVMIRLSARLHSRRPRRHSSDSNAHDIRPLAEKPLNDIHRHMPFDYIPTDDGRMTRMQVRWNSELRFYRPDVGCILCHDPEPVTPHVIHPSLAAAAGGALVNRHLDRITHRPMNFKRRMRMTTGESLEGRGDALELRKEFFQ